MFVYVSDEKRKTNIPDIFGPCTITNWKGTSQHFVSPDAQQLCLAASPVPSEGFRHRRAAIEQSRCMLVAAIMIYLSERHI